MTENSSSQKWVKNHFKKLLNFEFIKKLIKITLFYKIDFFFYKINKLLILIL